MTPGLVSTIVPVHNRAALLGEAVASVLAQSYRPIEVIVVDDGSTDATPATIAALGAAHPDVVRVVAQPRGGPGRAREAGRRAARGEFLQYLDSDDILLPRKFELQVAALRRLDRPGVAYGITEESDPGGTVRATAWQPSDRPIEHMFPEFLRRRFWQTASPLYAAAVCERAGAWSDLWLEEDWEYDCRIAALDPPLAFVPEVVCRHRHASDDRLSQGAALDPQRLAQRAIAHERILGHALAARVSRATPELQHFARELFLLSRQAGAAGLVSESRRLFACARRASTRQRAFGSDFIAYRGLGAIFGWATVGRLSAWLDRWRSGGGR